MALLAIQRKDTLNLSVIGCDWVNKWFPFRDFIHCTKEKGFTRCTHFVDDRNKYLNQQPEGVKLIKM